MDNTTKYALITGATSGIGYELAKLFAKDRYSLVIVARNQEELSRTASELKQQNGIQVETISKDLFDRKAAFEVYEEVKSKGIHIDILVNDAGQGEYGLFVDSDINRQLELVQLNIEAVLILTHSFLKDMVAKGEGRILNLASIASEMPGPWQAVYHGTKAFVLSFSEALRIEVKNKGVIVTALLPGATDTDFFNKADMRDSKIVQESKLSDPEKVAKDGYEALMSGDEKIVSGFKNKMMVAMSNIMPDDMTAKQMEKQQKPVEQRK